MRIVFLDIDGVLNRKATRERLDGFIGIDAVLARRLQAILRRAGAQVVLSSTWRLWPDTRKAVNDAGIRFIGAPIVDKLAKDVASVVNDPAFRERHLTARSLVPAINGPEQFAEEIKRDRAAAARVVKEAGLTPQ